MASVPSNPMVPGRDRWLAGALVELSDTLDDEFDVVGLFRTFNKRARELVFAGETLILLLEGTEPMVADASSEHMQRVGGLVTSSGEGPLIDALRSGSPIVNITIDDSSEPFAIAARDGGFRQLHAVPLRHGDEVFGVIGLFRDCTEPLSDADADALQALADMSALSLLHHRALDAARTLATQLQGALKSRVAIEQAKGVLAERLQVDVDEAFSRLRAFARRTNRSIDAVAREVVAGALDPSEMNTEGPRRPRR